MESTNTLPFRQLKKDIYRILDVLKFIEYKDALKFLFTINKDMR